MEVPQGELGKLMTSLSLSFESGPHGKAQGGVGCEGIGQAGGGEAALLYAWVFCRWFLYIIFVFLLGAICTREALRYDFLIAEKVGESCTNRGSMCQVVCLFPLQMAACPLQFCLGIHIVLGPGQKMGTKPWTRSRLF